MRGFADILVSPGAATITDDERDEFLTIIRAESDRSIRLINRILNVGRIEAGRGVELILSPTDLGALARRVVDMAETLSDKHVLRIDVDEGVPQVEADCDQVAEVLLNLIGNAVKYSPDGGDVVVRVAAAEDGVCVSVADSGIGMTPEQVSRLFGRYQRVLSDAPIAGTGLGLYLSKGIVDAHGGRIWAESEPGRGSTFFFTLPSRSSPASSPG
jgi:signal transduction histidine kinase